MTYFVQAMASGYDPSGDPTNLASERAAMLLIYLYTDQVYSLLPTVEREYRRIPDQQPLDAHEAVASALFLDVLDRLPAEELKRRLTDLMRFHPSPSDCLVLAEAELVGVSFLLNFDGGFVSRLGAVARGVCVMKPSAYWESLEIRRGVQPVRSPKASNPLANMDWWRL